MPVWLMVVPILMTMAADHLAAEPLDRRFGPDRERGYRSYSEYERTPPGFSNRDRANFLGSKSRPAPEPAAPRIDLQSPANIGLQR